MALQGPQKLAILLCKFSDSAGTEPHPTSFYRDLFVKRGTGGLNDYWIAASLGAINLDGSEVFDWKTLENTRAEYLAAYIDAEGKVSRGGLVDGAIDAFKVERTQYVGFVAIFNADVNDGGAASSNILAHHGGNDDSVNVTFLAHETGHVFGLEHSFDTSARIAVPEWPSAAGEYFDSHDIMSAMNVNSDAGHQFSPRGPLLNVANLDRMGWLPAARVWYPMSNSSHSYDVDIVALEHPEVSGYLAATARGWIAEFRIPDGFDRGLRRPAVLFHNEAANPNSTIIASDAANNIHEWQPGQVYVNRLRFDQSGGTWVTVVSFDLQKKTARLRVVMKATRPPFLEPEVIFGLGIGQLPRDGVILVLRGGKIVPIPVPFPEPPISPDFRAIIRGHVLDILKEDLGANITDLQTDFTDDRLT
jgi:hypothetical protein